MYNKVLIEYGSKNLCLGVTQNSQLGTKTEAHYKHIYVYCIITCI